MKENSDKNNSLIRTDSQSLAKVENSLRVTDRILNEMQASNRTWWNGLSRKWQKVICANYVLQIADKNSDFPIYYRGRAEWNLGSSALNLYRHCFGNFNLEDIDLSIIGLERMLKVPKIDCSLTSFRNYSPVSKFNNLEGLYLHDSEFTDFNHISPLIPSLLELDIGSTKVRTIEPLTEAKSLISLEVGSNKISDFSSLVSISDSLRKLTISNCPANNKTISILKNLNLEELKIRNTSINDISFIKNYTSVVSILERRIKSF